MDLRVGKEELYIDVKNKNIRIIKANNLQLRPKTWSSTTRDKYLLEEEWKKKKSSIQLCPAEALGIISRTVHEYAKSILFFIYYSVIIVFYKALDFVHITSEFRNSITYIDVKEQFLCFLSLFCDIEKYWRNPESRE